MMSEHVVALCYVMYNSWSHYVWHHNIMLLPVIVILWCHNSWHFYIMMLLWYDIVDITLWDVITLLCHYLTLWCHHYIIDLMVSLLLWHNIMKLLRYSLTTVPYYVIIYRCDIIMLWCLYLTFWCHFVMMSILYDVMFHYAIIIIITVMMVL